MLKTWPPRNKRGQQKYHKVEGHLHEDRAQIDPGLL